MKCKGQIKMKLITLYHIALCIWRINLLNMHEYTWIYAGRIINFTSYNMIWEERKNRNKNRWRMEFFFSLFIFFSFCFLFFNMHATANIVSLWWMKKISWIFLLYYTITGDRMNARQEKIAIWGAQTSKILSTAMVGFF